MPHLSQVTARSRCPWRPRPCPELSQVLVSKQPRTEGVTRTAVREYALYALLAPLVALVLGLLGAWVVAGFARKGEGGSEVGRSAGWSVRCPGGCWSGTPKKVALRLESLRNVLLANFHFVMIVRAFQ
jgi:hypothetical protein